jgi:putative transferase (TIGR04331 family)
MASTSLCTTALEEFWNLKAEKIIFLGHWCLRYDRQDDWKNLNYEVLPHPWDDREAMHRAALYEEEVYEELLNILIGFLEDIHGEKHAQQYWRILLGPWLLHYIQALHERYLCLDQAFKRYPDLKTIGLATSSFNIPRHTRDHLVGSTDDPYNLQLYTILLQNMGYQVAVRDFKWSWDERKEGKGLSRFSNPFLQNLIVSWAKRGPALLVDMYIPRKKVASLMVKCQFKARWARLPESEKWLGRVSKVDLHARRNDLGQLILKKEDPFKTVLVKTLPFNFPLIYLEVYKACRAWVNEKWGKSGVRKILTANALELNETFKFIAAELKERGAKLVAVQHGGSHGSAKCNPNEALEVKVADEYWSWGWSGEENGVRPMPNPKLSSLASIKRPASSKGKRYILYIGNIVARYHYRTWSCPTANQGLQYLDWQVNFLKSLDVGVRSALLFRPYPVDYGWNLRQRLKDAIPDLKMDDHHGDYYKELIGASLVICDMNQTSLSESLAANMPTIAFWDPRFWEIRSDAEPYFQHLQDAGILYHSPIDAADAVNRLWPKVEEWWVRHEVQEARKKFVLRYALNDPDWASVWREQILKQLPIAQKV